MNEKDVEIINVNYGEIKIYKDTGAHQSQTSKRLSRRKFKKDNETSNLKTQTDPAKQGAYLKLDRCKTEEDEFFSFDNQSNTRGLNYFDEQLVDQYKQINQKVESESLNAEKPSISIQGDSKDYNYFDEIYFIHGQQNTNSNANTDKIYPQTSGKSKNDVKIATNITKQDLCSSVDMNPIDEAYFKNLDYSSYADQTDSLIGSIAHFKTMKKKERKQLVVSESIPIITQENVALDTENSVLPKVHKSATIVKESEHKVFQSFLHNWQYIKMDEAAKILKNHVCYINEEQGLLAIDKPYGLPSIGGPGVHLSVSKLLPQLEAMIGLKQKLFMCNRLDEFTTGVMLLALNVETAAKIHNYFSEKKVIKQYVAITKSKPNFPTGEIHIPLLRRKINNNYKTYLSPNIDKDLRDIVTDPQKDNENRKDAITKYRIMDSNDFGASLLEIQPLTGFQHQIRAHLSYGLNCPILGDHKYSHHVELAPQRLCEGFLKAFKIKQSKVRYIPMHLHSYRTILPEFCKNTNIFIDAKLPLHFVNSLKKLKLRF